MNKRRDLAELALVLLVASAITIIAISIALCFWIAK